MQDGCDSLHYRWGHNGGRREGGTGAAMKPATFTSGHANLERLEQRFLLALNLLDPMTQPKFVNPLPIPGVVQPTTPGGTSYRVSISQFQQELGLYDPLTGQPLRTTVWGYNGSYPGPTFVAT